jgi:hypothetical protein
VVSAPFFIFPAVSIAFAVIRTIELTEIDFLQSPAPEVKIHYLSSIK